MIIAPAYDGFFGFIILVISIYCIIKFNKELKAKNKIKHELRDFFRSLERFEYEGTQGEVKLSRKAIKFGIENHYFGFKQEDEFKEALKAEPFKDVFYIDFVASKSHL